MANTYSLSEVFRMAEQIESNGMKFYTEAADQVKDKRTKNVFLDLAEKEKEHEKLFGELRRQFYSQEDLFIVDPDGQVEAYIRAAADTHVFNLNPDVSDLLASVQSPRSTLQLAIGFEKDTIAYFTALKQAVTDENRPKVEMLIQEEVGHIRQLHEAIKQLDQG